VFVGVLLYFGRRGQENLRDLCEHDFGMTTDNDDEQTKNKIQTKTA
jgi:hypothetical protein